MSKIPNDPKKPIPPSVEDRLELLEKLARENGWAIPPPYTEPPEFTFAKAPKHK